METKDLGYSKKNIPVLCEKQMIPVFTAPEDGKLYYYDKMEAIFATQPDKKQTKCKTLGKKYILLMMTVYWRLNITYSP